MLAREVVSFLVCKGSKVTTGTWDGICIPFEHRRGLLELCNMARTMIGLGRCFGLVLADVTAEIRLYQKSSPGAELSYASSVDCCQELENESTAVVGAAPAALQRKSVVRKANTA